MAGTALHQGGGGKGRRVGGRRDEMQGGVHYAVSAQEDDMVIKQRLVTRTTTTRGEPPLKRLQKRFVGFVSEIEKDADNVSDCDRLYKSLLQEITTFELPLLRTQSVTDAHKREKENFTVLQGELHHQILQAQSDIEALKQQLEDSQVERRHKEECEAIRRLIGGQPPRVETQKTISQLEEELSCLEAQNTASTRTLELRKKQFYLLLHVVEELQNAMDEEQRTITEEMRSALEEKSSIGEPSSALPAIDAVIANQPEAMQIG